MPETKKNKVLFFLPNLMAGGAERVMSFIAQHIDKNKFSTVLYVIGYEKDQAFETPLVRTVFLNKKRVLSSIPDLYRTIHLEKPNVVITAIGHLNITMSLISLFFPKIRFIGREVNIISILKNYPDTEKRNEFPILSTLAYKILDYVICQSEDMAKDLIENYKVNMKKIVVINNPITHQFQVKQKPVFPSKVFQLITIGRLAKQKGHLRILESLKDLRVPFHYTIVGEGPEKEAIMTYIRENGLTDRISHVSFTNKVSEYLAKSHVFLQGSYVEGFPNALIESIAVGTPAIAYEAKGGIDEIIQEGVNGHIVTSVSDFTQKLEGLLNSVDVWDPARIAETVNKKYGAKEIVSQYEELLTRAT